MKYRKKPVTIEAECWDGSFEVFFKIMEFTKSVPAEAQAPITRGDGNSLLIHTLEGTMTATIGDWIIQGIKGKICPLKDKIFKETYEKVEE